MRLKSKWGDKTRTRSPEDNASAAAFIAWRAAQEQLLNLENEDFQTNSLKQRMDVVMEFVIYLAHMADRLAYEFMQEDERQRFVVAMVKHLARNVQTSMEDIDGVKDYKEDFISLVNERMEDYAEMPFEDGEPSFAMRRYLGGKVQLKLGERHNKWVETQVLEIDAKEAFKNIKKGIENLYKPAF